MTSATVQTILQKIKLSASMEQVPETADAATQEEWDVLERAANHADHVQDINLRKLYSNRIFWLICGYLIFVSALLAACAWKNGFFALSDSVLITLLSTTTANIVALFAIVTRYIFPKKI